MNQEQNNLNENNFNMQGNNGIPNSQPLNNQNFNNTFNQNVEQSASVNQSESNYQQPINQMNMQQPTSSFEQPVIQNPQSKPVNSFESVNTNNQNFNSKPPKKMNLGLIIGVIVIIVAIIIIILILSNTLKDNKQNNDSNNSSTSAPISKEGIKKIDEDDFNVYILKNNGDLYAIDSFSPINIKKVVNDVDNFIVTDEGLFFTTFEKKSYIINGYLELDPETNELIEDKNLETSEGNAVLIELKNIKNVVDYNMYDDSADERPILFLTEDGNVYKYIINESIGKQSFEKVMDNVKELYGDFYNKVLVDNNNTYYVFGENKIPNGILGTSDFSYGSSNNNYVTYKNKKELGKNLKDITIVSNSEHIEVYMIDNNNNLSVIGFGLSYDYEQTMNEYINRIDTPLVIESNIEKVYPDLKNIYLKKIDGSLWHRGFSYGSKENKKIVDKNVKNVYLGDNGYGGIFILMENNDLYVYGENSLLKFGVGEDIKEYDEPTKIYSNISNVYDFDSGAMIVTKNNEIYYSGKKYNVSKWTKLEI